MDQPSPSGINQQMLHARMMKSATWLTVPDVAQEETVAVTQDQIHLQPLVPSASETGFEEVGNMKGTMPRLGFFVDFTGHDDLLAEFIEATEKVGLDPSESVLDIVYLFAHGDLHLKV